MVMIRPMLIGMCEVNYEGQSQKQIKANASTSSWMWVGAEQLW